MAEYNPFAPEYMNPNMGRTGLYDLRMMSAANRAEQPFMHSQHSYRSAAANNPMLAGMMDAPDYSQFTFNPAAHAAASDALAPYGLAPLEASQVQRNTILPNTGFFGRHPGLSGAIEGAVYGGLASHGGNTPGESIQGALEGLVGGRQLQRAAYNRQFARPFEAAGMAEHLEDLQQKRELQKAQIKRYSDESDIQRERAETERAKAGIVSDRIAATRPWTDPVTGQTYTYQEGGPPTLNKDLIPTGGQPGWKPLEGTGPGTIQRASGAGRSANPWSGQSKFENFARMRGWKTPADVPAGGWSTLQQDYEAEQGRLANKRGYQGGTGRSQVPGNLTPQQREQLKPIDTAMNKLDSTEWTKRTRREVMLDPAWASKPLDQQNAEVERRREDARTQFNKRRDQIMGGQAAPPEAAGGGKVLTEGQDF